MEREDGAAKRRERIVLADILPLHRIRSLLAGLADESAQLEVRHKQRLKEAQGKQREIAQAQRVYEARAREHSELRRAWLELEAELTERENGSEN